MLWGYQDDNVWDENTDNDYNDDDEGERMIKNKCGVNIMRIRLKLASDTRCGRLYV